MRSSAGKGVPTVVAERGALVVAGAAAAAERALRAGLRVVGRAPDPEDTLAVGEVARRVLDDRSRLAGDVTRRRAQEPRLEAPPRRREEQEPDEELPELRRTVQRRVGHGGEEVGEPGAEEEQADDEQDEAGDAQRVAHPH